MKKQFFLFVGTFALAALSASAGCAQSSTSGSQTATPPATRRPADCDAASANGVPHAPDGNAAGQHGHSCTSDNYSEWHSPL